MMGAIVKIRQKGQLTIPADILKRLRLKIGDFIEIAPVKGGILLKPKKIIDADQAWFWTEDWQKGEKEAGADIEAGRVERFESAEDLLDALD